MKEISVYKSLPLGEGAEQSEADEGTARSVFSTISGKSVQFSLISQKSKIFASFPQGEALDATAPLQLFDKLHFGSL